MISASTKLKENLENGVPLYEVLTITFADGTKKTIDKELMYSGNSITDGSESSSFPIGASICKSLSACFDNSDGAFDDAEFYGAEIHCVLRMDYSDGTSESINRGYFTITSPVTRGETIKVTALDDMYKANVTYTGSNDQAISLSALVQRACDLVGIVTGFTMKHDNIQISEIPAGTTVRQIIECAALVECANARIDTNGKLQLVPWNLASVADLKDFVTAPTLSSDDIVITGIKLTNGEDSYLYGEEGYVIGIDTTLIDAELLPTVSEYLGSLIGKTFRSMSGNLVNNPFLEFGDVVTTYDRKSTGYRTPLTDITYTHRSYTIVKASAEDPINGVSDFNSGATKTYARTKKLVEKEINARKNAIDTLEKTLENASGMYETSETQPDGSIITYFHDKANLSDSSKIIKITSDAIGVSTDGGESYPYGFTLDGDTITRILYATGINADYITTGAFKVTDKDGNIIFSADKDNKSVTISGASVTIGVNSLTDKLSDIEEAVNEIEGRNLLLGTSNTWSDWYIPTPNKSNRGVFPFGKSANCAFASVGQQMTFSADIEWNGFTASESGTFLITQVAYWSNDDESSVAYSPAFKLVGSIMEPPEDGVIHYSETTTINIDRTDKTTVQPYLRFDYIGSGKLRVKNVKLETGNKATNWTPAPEDLATEEELGALTERVLNAESKITQQADLIETKVSKDGIISTINQSAETVTIQANKIKLEGAVTQSGGFSIDENGNMTATNGTFTGVVNATSGSFNGKLTAESGTIGGWTIGKSALYKNTKTLTDTTTGTYIGTDGIINRNSSYVQIKDGKLTASTQEGARAVIGSMINEEWPIKVYSGENSSMSAAIGYDGLVYAQGVSDMGNLSVGGNATIDGKATIGGHVFLNNAKDIFCQLSDGTNIDVMHMSTTDHLVIGGGLRTNTEASFSNIYLDTQGDIIFRIGDSTKSTSLRVYREYGDSITISGIALTGYISNSSKSAYFTIPVDRPTIDSSCAVTVEGVTLRQGGKYLYGSSASKDVVPSSISAYVRGGNIYVAMTFSNTTNVINNETVGIYLTNVVIKYT